MVHRLGRGAAENALTQRRNDLARIDDGFHREAVIGAAIELGDDRVLRDVDETAREVTRVRRLQRRIRETLAGAVGGVEVLENVEAFLEVGRDRGLDDRAVRTRHQAAHAGELLHLGRRTTRPGVAHHIDRVDRLLTSGLLVDLNGSDALHHLVGDLVAALGPGVDNLVVLFALGDEAVIVLLLELLDLLAGLLDDFVLARRDHHVVLAEGNTGAGGMLEAEVHDPVTEDDRLLLAAAAIDRVDHLGDGLLGHQLVGRLERHLRRMRQELAEHHAAGRRLDDLGRILALVVPHLHATLDLGVHGHDAAGERVLDLAHVGERHALPRLTLVHEGEVIEAEHDVLRRHDDRLAVRRMQDVVGRHHQDARFQLGLEAQRNVHGHLVAVEVGVERGTHQRVELDGLAFDQDGLERLDAQAVKRRRTVQENRVLADHFIEDIPDLGLLLLDQLLGLLDGRRLAERLQAGVNERLEQLERHLLRQAALVQLQGRADHDHGAA